MSDVDPVHPAHTEVVRAGDELRRRRRLAGIAERMVGERQRAVPQDADDAVDVGASVAIALTCEMINIARTGQVGRLIDGPTFHGVGVIAARCVGGRPGAARRRVPLVADRRHVAGKIDGDRQKGAVMVGDRQTALDFRIVRQRAGLINRSRRVDTRFLREAGRLRRRQHHYTGNRESDQNGRGRYPRYSGVHDILAHPPAAPLRVIGWQGALRHIGWILLAAL